MIKKKFAATALAAVLTFSLATTAFGHDGWTQTNAPIIAQGEVSYVDLLFGNHSNNHSSYRITGQWNKDTTKVFVTSPDGKKTDITSTRYYTGEAATDTEPAVNNGFVATFSASAPGAYVITAEQDTVNKASASRSFRSAKSFVAVSDIPTAERVKGLKGFSKPVNLDRAELLPQFNPTSVTSGEEAAFQLVLKGKPVADVEVSVTRRSTGEAQTFKTDAQGSISLKAGPADYYLVRTSTTTDEAKEGEYKTVSYTATLTFTVQNGTAKLPAAQVNPVPQVYVNGKLIETTGISISNGSTVADASFIRSNIDSAFTGESAAALRIAAEKAGASVEYLPTVGGNRAAVLIYTK